MLKEKDVSLVVVDVQGKLATLMHRRDEFFDNLVKMIKGAQVMDIPVLWNEQLPDKLGETIPQIKELFPGQSPMVKKTFSCCGNADFTDRLKGSNRKQVLLVGMESHVCVYQTAMDLLKSGYEVNVVADCVSSRSPENRQNGLDTMRENGANITNLEMALFELLGTAEGDRFKQIIKIIK